MFNSGRSPSNDDPAPHALQARRIVAGVVFPHFPRDRLRPAGVGRVGQLPADVFDLVDRRQRRHFVPEQPLMIRVFPSRVARIVRVADAMVLDPLADLHDVFFEFLEAAGKIAVDHRLGQRIVDGDDHRGVFAGRIVGLVVLRFDVAARGVQQHQGVFPRPGDAIAFGHQYGNAGHGVIPFEQKIGEGHSGQRGGFSQGGKARGGWRSLGDGSGKTACRLQETLPDPPKKILSPTDPPV